MSCDSFLHVKKSSMALFNLLAYASCYFIQKRKSTVHLLKSNCWMKTHQITEKVRKKSRKTWIVLFASSDFAHDWNFECTSTCHLSQKFAVVVSWWDHVCRIIPESNYHVHLSLSNCAAIWFIKWTHEIWDLLEDSVRQRLKVRTNAKIDKVRAFDTSTWNELCYFSLSKHSNKQGLFVGTGIQRIVILNYSTQ